MLPNELDALPGSDVYAQITERSDQTLWKSSSTLNSQSPYPFILVSSCIRTG